MPDRRRLPSLTRATEWLNSGPLGPADLDGRVLLVNFWTLTCINWLRQVPWVRAWWRAYRDDGLVVVGVHTPEFSFEHDVDRVWQAVKDREIDYPVALDDGYAVWSAFDNHYWPALYFADRDGVLRDFHFGEGRYEQSERRIQELLGVRRDLVTVTGTGVEAAADWDHLRTPETYLGADRGTRFSQWALDGAWTVGAESVRLDRDVGRIALHYQARDAHLVLARPAGEPVPFQVFLDGAAPGESHGVDVDARGAGTVIDSRLYHLVRLTGPVEEQTLEIVFSEPGVEAYAFTFG